MFPVAIEGRTRYRAYVTFTLLLINVLVFLIEVLVQLGGERATIEFFRAYALSVCSVGAEPITLTARNALFSLFLHGNLLHLIGNMTMLWIFAPRVEAYFGHRRFLLVYLLMGMASFLAHYWLGGVACVPGAQGTGLIIGASGAIAGVMGAFLFLYPGARVRTVFLVRFWRLPAIPLVTVPLSAWMYLSYWFIFDLLKGLGVLASVGVAHWAHIGGFVFGFGVAFFAGMFKPAPTIGAFDYLDD